MDIERRSEASQFSQITGMIEGLPELHMPRRKRILLLFAGIGLAILDLGCLPLTYYYALKFDTKLSLQISMSKGARAIVPVLADTLCSFRRHNGSLWFSELLTLWPPVTPTVSSQNGPEMEAHRMDKMGDGKDP